MFLSGVGSISWSDQTFFCFIDCAWWSTVPRSLRFLYHRSRFWRRISIMETIVFFELEFGLLWRFFRFYWLFVLRPPKWVCGWLALLSGRWKWSGTTIRLSIVFTWCSSLRCGRSGGVYKSKIRREN